MDFLEECVNAFAKQDLSTCKPFGLDLATWFAALGIGIVAIIYKFWKAISTVIIAVLRRFQPKPGPIPQRQAATLFGRDGDIARLDEVFKGAPVAVAITGLGGIGKTALAEDYGRLRHESGRYRDWVLVSTASDTGMANDLRSIAALLGVENNPNPKTIIDLTYKAMAESGDRWLVILDNVDDEADQRRVLKNLRSADRIDQIITSRIKDWHDRAVSVDLDLLPPDDAVELLAWASGREPDDALRALAVKTLECLPLALVVAGGDLRSMNIQIDRYADEFNERLRETPPGRVYEKSIYAAVTGSVERLSANAQAFLKLAAYMEPADIDLGHLQRGAEAIKNRGWAPLPAPFAALAESDVTLHAATAECAQHSLLTDARWKEENTFRIHRMTQFVLRDWMGEEGRKETIGLAGQLGTAQFTDDPQFDTESWPRCRRLAPHARVLAEFGAEVDGPGAKNVTTFVHETASFLYFAASDLRLVMRLYEQNLANVERDYGADSADYAAALGNLASVQDELGRVSDADEAVRLDQQAEKNYKIAIQIREGRKEHDLRRAYIRNNLGEFYRARRRFHDALKEYSESRRILDEASAGGELIGGAHANMGVLYAEWAGAVADDEEKAEYRRLALSHKKKGLELTRDALGEMCFDTAICHHNISFEYVALGDWEKALPHAIRAAAITLAMLEQGVIDDPDHPQLRDRLDGLRLAIRGLDRDPNEADSLARAQIPEVLADHAAWKERKGTDRDVDRPGGAASL